MHTLVWFWCAVLWWENKLVMKSFVSKRNFELIVSVSKCVSFWIFFLLQVSVHVKMAVSPSQWGRTKVTLSRQWSDIIQLLNVHRGKCSWIYSVHKVLSVNQYQQTKVKDILPLIPSHLTLLWTYKRCLKLIKGCRTFLSIWHRSGETDQLSVSLLTFYTQFH